MCKHPVVADVSAPYDVKHEAFNAACIHSRQLLSSKH